MKPETANELFDLVASLKMLEGGLKTFRIFMSGGSMQALEPEVLDKMASKTSNLEELKMFFLNQS